MASIRVLSEDTSAQKRYQVTYEERVVGTNTRKRRSKTFPVGTPIREVKKFKRQKEEEYEKSKGVDLAYINITLSAFLPEFLQYVENNMSASTLRTYRQSIFDKNIGVEKYFGEMQLKQIQTSQIQNYVRILEHHTTKKGNKMAPKTIINTIYILSSIIEFAKRMNYLERSMVNPCQYVVLPKKEKKEPEIFTLEEAKQVLNILEEEENLMLLFAVKMSMLVGLRRSELAALRFSDFNLKEKTLKISRARVYGCGVDVEKNTKTSASNRILAIPDSIVDLVRTVQKYKIRCRSNSDGDYVENDYLYVDEKGNPLKVSSITNNWLKFLDKHPEIKKTRFHDLRHFFCSCMVNIVNVDSRNLMEMMGHSSLNMSIGTYAHSFIETKKSYVDKLNDVFYESAN